MFPHWDKTLIAVSASLHSSAILSTLFRLWYRWYMERLWWDDAWVVLAFLADIVWLTVAVMEQPTSGGSVPHFFSVGNWMISFAYPILMWATRISILASIVRVSRPEGSLRYVTFGIGALFGIMGTAMLGQRLQVCIVKACFMTKTILITQTITDCVADVLLSALPIWLLRSVKLSRKRKILIVSALSASMVINFVTVAEVIVLFRTITSGSVVFEHAKAACSMLVCNLLVITTFVYRILYKGTADFEDSIPNTTKVVEFTTVDLAGLEDTSKATSLGATRSSTWSFRIGSQTKTSVSATATMPGVSAVSRNEHGDSQTGLSIN